MKKIILTVLLLLLIPLQCLANNVASSTHITSKGELVVQSDSRTFDVLKGVYELRGNVYVNLPIRKKKLAVKADRASVHIYDLEVHCSGNINLVYNDLNFKCDTVDVFHEGRIAYVTGNLQFDDGKTKIMADKGSYCWKTKLAIFEGNVVVNGEPKNNSVTYHVVNKKIV